VGLTVRERSLKTEEKTEASTNCDASPDVRRESDLVGGSP